MATTPPPAPAKGKVPANVLALAKEITTMAAANKILTAAHRSLNKAGDDIMKVPVVAAKAGVRGALRDRVQIVRSFVQKLQMTGTNLKDPPPEGFRNSVALASIQTTDALKTIDDAVTDKNLRFAANFKEAAKIIIMAPVVAAKKVVAAVKPKPKVKPKPAATAPPPPPVTTATPMALPPSTPAAPVKAAPLVSTKTPVKGKVPAKVLALAAQITTLDQAMGILAAADKSLSESGKDIMQVPVIAAAAGLRGALRDAVTIVRNYVQKLQAQGRGMRDPLSENFRQQVALAAIQTTDALKKIDDAVTDPELRFGPAFVKAMGVVLKGAGQAVATVATVTTKALLPTLPILLPVALAVGAGLFFMTKRA